MMVNAVRKEIWRTDHNVAMAFAETLENFLNIFSYGQPRFGLLLVSIFAVIGLILVAMGVYSVIAYDRLLRPARPLDGVRDRSRSRARSNPDGSEPLLP